LRDHHDSQNIRARQESQQALFLDLGSSSPAVSRIERRDRGEIAHGELLGQRRKARY